METKITVTFGIGEPLDSLIAALDVLREIPLEITDTYRDNSGDITLTLEVGVNYFFRISIEQRIIRPGQQTRLNYSGTGSTEKATKK